MLTYTCFTTRTGRLRLLALLTAVIVSAVGAPPSAVSAAKKCPRASVMPADPEDLPRAIKDTVCQVNRARVKRGRKALPLSNRLTAAASSHAFDMANRDYFGLASPDSPPVTLADRVNAVGYYAPDGSRDIAFAFGWATGADATPKRTIRRMLRGHTTRRALLYRRARSIGVGPAIGIPEARPANGMTYVIILGVRVTPGTGVFPVRAPGSPAPGAQGG